MTSRQQLIAFMFAVLVVLSVHEYWQPQLSALVHT